MKIIHCGDIHLDSKMECNLSGEQALIRKSEILSTFSKMIDFANQNEVKAIIIAGDLFDTARATKKSVAFLTDLFRKNQEIDFLYLRGNHDEAGFLKDVDAPKNLKQFDEKWTTFDYDAIKITGINITKENCNTLYNSLNLQETATNIVVMHGQEGQTSGVDKINLTELKNKNIDYLALGHIHSYKSAKLDSRGTYAYCGCLEGRGFDECGEKGFVLIDADENGLNQQFVPFSARKIYEISVDITGLLTYGEILDSSVLQLENVEPNSIVKLVLTGFYTTETNKDAQLLATELSQKFFFIKVVDKSRIAINIDDYKYDVSLKGEFIRKVWATNLDDCQKGEIISIGLKALAGEELDI